MKITTVSISQRALLKSMVRGAYDTQALRIETGNRLCANFRVKLGVEPGTKDEKEPKAEKILTKLKRDHKQITEGVVKITRRRTFEYCGLISDYTELILVDNWRRLVKDEARQFRDIGLELRDVPLWKSFLKGVKGAGPAMAGVILTEIDIAKSRHPSSLWKYAGLDVGDDGKARSRRKEHLIDVEYVDKKGELNTKKSITYNPFLKTKLMGVLGPSFIKLKSPYADIYYDYKNRLEHHAVYKDVAAGHRHTMATRYMIKMFLIDLHLAWRVLEGFPPSTPYHEAILGHKHGETQLL